MTSLRILSGGAAQGLVKSLIPQFKTLSGLGIEGEFGAVGAMAEKLRAGEPTDIVILTTAVIEALIEARLLASDSVTAIGIVETALAVRAGGPLVTATDATALRGVFLASDAIFVPDIKTSTAGIHVAKILQQLGIADDVAQKLRIFPNGAIAMRNLAASNAVNPIGCTQSTEIISTPGVDLSGSLPKQCALATVYSAAITVQTKNDAAVQSLIDLLTDKDQRELRLRMGFLDVAP